VNLANNSRASTAVGLLSLVILLPGVVGCGTVVTQDLEKFQKAGPVRFEVDVAALVQAKTPIGPYRVVPGDLLSIHLPVLDPLSNSLTDGSSGILLRRVDDDGSIWLPLHDKVAVSGKSFSEIEAQITKIYYPGMLNHSPGVVVQVADYSTRYVDLVGGVLTPGRYQLRSDEMSLVAALMKAGNVTAQGAGLIRIGRPGEKEFKEVMLPIKGATQPFADVPLSGGETIEVAALYGQLFTVVGLIKQPGTYNLPVGARINLIQALGLAGGVDPISDPRQVVIYRQDDKDNLVSARFELNGNKSWAWQNSLFDDSSLGEGAFVRIKAGDVIVLENTLRTRTRTFLAQTISLSAGASATANTQATYYKDFNTSGGTRSRQ